MTAHKPATALPWTHLDPSRGTQPQPEHPTKVCIHTEEGYESVGCAWVKSGDTAKAKTDAAYIVHAANAYPKLVEALRNFVSEYEGGDSASRDDAYSLLRELGESK